jgi:hypothetical protein
LSDVACEGRESGEVTWSIYNPWRSGGGIQRKRHSGWSVHAMEGFEQSNIRTPGIESRRMRTWVVHRTPGTRTDHMVM